MNGIGWTDKTINPVGGCSHASPGCENCWAECDAVKLTKRSTPAIKARYSLLVTDNRRWARHGDGTPVFGIYPSVVQQLVRATGRHKGECGYRQKRWFVGSMADLFHPQRPTEDIQAVLGALAGNGKRPVFQLVTKHPEVAVAQLLRAATDWGAAWRRTRDWLHEQGLPTHGKQHVEPRIVLLTSVENSKWARTRIPAVVEAKKLVSAVGLSIEPLLGPVDLDATGHLHLLDWAIAGGESGKGARHCDLSWIVRVINQSKNVGMPLFVKQLGARPVWSGSLPLLRHAGFQTKTDSYLPFGEPNEHEETPFRRPDPPPAWLLEFKRKKSDDPSKWPPEYRVRQHPQGL